MKKSFLNAQSPFVTEMIQVKTTAQAKIRIQNAIACGATAIGLQLQTMESRYRTDSALCDLFSTTGDKPLYVTNYRGCENEGVNDETLMNGLLTALDCGATLVDLMGDTFAPAPEELTTDSAAVAKQMRFIDEVHKKGGEVLMSSHVHSFRNAERVLEIAKAQESRGADVVKIVTGAETQEEELKNLEICALLKKELKVPFLFLSGGKYNKLHRNIGPALGVCMWLCFREYDDFTYPGPPLLENVLKIREALQV